VGAQGGQEVERGKDPGRGGIAAGAALAAVVDDLAGFRAIAQAFDLMIQFSLSCFTCFRAFFRSRYNLSLEIIPPRQQLGVL
jgi:hypothetical protein